MSFHFFPIVGTSYMQKSKNCEFSFCILLCFSSWTRWRSSDVESFFKKMAREYQGICQESMSKAIAIMDTFSSDSTFVRGYARRTPCDIWGSFWKPLITGTLSTLTLQEGLAFLIWHFFPRLHPLLACNHPAFSLSPAHTHELSLFDSHHPFNIP